MDESMQTCILNSAIKFMWKILRVDSEFYDFWKIKKEYKKI